MTLKDKQKRNILLVLLAVLGVTLALGYRVNRPGTPAAARTPEPKASQNPQTASNARIRMDLVEKSGDSENVGRNNVFQYREWRAAPLRGMAHAAPTPPSLLQPSVTSVPVVTPPPGPPPPPPIPFRYQGFAVVNSAPSALTAFLGLDPARHYNATVGEVFMGRYRIVGITEKTVEVEDLQNNRRQSIPLQK